MAETPIAKDRLTRENPKKFTSTKFYKTQEHSKIKIQRKLYFHAQVGMIRIDGHIDTKEV
jgi:hypothetical protein